MRQNKSPLRGSVTQNNASVRMHAREQEGLSFLARLGLLGGGLLVILVLIFWSWHSGWLPNQARHLRDTGLNASQEAQFAIKDITVVGRNQSSKDEIFDALGAARGAPILGFDVKAAAARLGKLPWISSAVVERRLPDTLVVILTERTPMARWQHDDHFYVLDNEGHVLSVAKPENFTSLPLVVGNGADGAAQSFLALLKNHPDIMEKTGSVVRVGDRRWDLHLQPNIVVRLPEQGVNNALNRLSILMGGEERILDRDIVAIDLRLADRLVVEPAAPAVPTRPTGVKK